MNIKSKVFWLTVKVDVLSEHWYIVKSKTLDDVWAESKDEIKSIAKEFLDVSDYKFVISENDDDLFGEGDEYEVTRPFVMEFIDWCINKYD